MPTDLSMWDINPKSGSTPLTITWLGYLVISGYTPIYPVLNSEYVQLQVSMGNGQWVDIPGAAVQTSHNSSNGYEGYFSGTYIIPTTWGPGTYQFRVLYPGSMTKGLAAINSPTVAITIIGSGGSVSNQTLIIVGAVGVAAVILGIIAAASSKSK